MKRLVYIGLFGEGLYGGRLEAEAEGDGGISEDSVLVGVGPGEGMGVQEAYPQKSHLTPTYHLYGTQVVLGLPIPTAFGKPSESSLVGAEPQYRLEGEGEGESAVCVLGQYMQVAGG